eukprot:6830114-Pyramimonas_sp.AAC.1
MLIRLVHLGRPSNDIPFLWNLSVQLHAAVDIVLEMPRFEYLRRRFADRPNPRASRLHFALAAVEEEIMSDFVGGLEEHVPVCYVNALMLDGAILRLHQS